MTATTMTTTTTKTTTTITITIVYHLCSVTPPYNHWIGFQNGFLSTSGGFDWTTGAPVDYANWDVGHPLPGGATCGYVSATGKWHSRGCQLHSDGFICEKEASGKTTRAAMLFIIRLNFPTIVIITESILHQQ